jgi:uncharacterized protein YbaR (Trm112 family)
MFVELLDKLRCPNAHEDSPLVANTASTVARYIMEGTLGCPVCSAEFRVHQGLLEMEGDFPVPMLLPETLSDESELRRAAQLGLDERGGLYLVDGIGSNFVPSFAGRSPDSRFIALSVMNRSKASAMSIRGRPDALPFAKGCLRGIAFDFETTPALLASAVQMLSPGGRLVAGADARVPDGIEILARDGEQWVGERAAVPVLSAIRRAPR